MDQKQESYMSDLKEVYGDIKDIAGDRFDKVVEELGLFETVLYQINEIFCKTLYNENNEAMITASVASIDGLRDNFRSEFIKETRKNEALFDLPDLGLVTSWVETIHLDIASQLFAEEFVSEALKPVYENITGAILDTESNIEETEEATESEEEDEAHN
jgi:trans-2-enoyl-CoA reductase